MNHLQVEALLDLLAHRRRVKLALLLKRHPMEQVVRSLIGDLDLIKLMWASKSHLQAEIEYVDYEIDLAIREISLGFKYEVIEK